MAKTYLPVVLTAVSPLLLITHGFSFQYRAAAPLKHRVSSALSSTAAADVDGADSATTAFWKWRGHDIFTDVRSSGASSNNQQKPAVILLHGFGASTTYWRETMSVLQEEGYDVHALDLLGQGRSSKPYSFEEEDVSSTPLYRLYSKNEDEDNKDATSSVTEMGNNTNTQVEYSINLWANLVDDYARHNQLEEVVLMGNSLGSLVALSAATGDFIGTSTDAYLAGNNDVGEHQSRVKGLCLFNCAIGLNSRNVIKNPIFGPIRRAIFGSLFDVLNNLIFDNAFLLRYALNNVVTKELLEDALKSLYICSPERVDRELVDSFYYPAIASTEGSVEAIRQIYTNDAGRTPLEFHSKYPEILDSLPLHLVWGLVDVVTPINGDVGTFYCDRVANNRGGNGKTTIDVVKSGHVPFDDNPVDTHDAMVRWLEKKVMK